MPKTKDQKRREAAERQACCDLKYLVSQIRTQADLDARTSLLSETKLVAFKSQIAELTERIHHNERIERERRAHLARR